MLEVPRLPFPAYAVGLVLAFAAGLALVRREARRQGLDVARITDLGVHVVLLSVVGARLAHVAADGDAGRYLRQCAVATPADCLAVFRFWEGGLVFYGGLALALGYGLAFARRSHLPVWRVADLFALALPLGLTFGRLGCHFHGCCYGAPTDLPWGVSFPPGSDASFAQAAAGLLPDADHASRAVHPTQLLSAGLCLAIFAALYLGVRPRQRFAGELASGFALLYGAARFGVELLRADPRGSLGPLSTSQWGSVALMTGAVVAWRALRHRPRQHDGESRRPKTG
jgi:phosphatidylglycerol:prolipoprotein diacylglycerol transferase